MVIDRMLLVVVFKWLHHRHWVFSDFFGIVEVQTENVGSHLSHFQEAPKFVQFPYRAHTDSVCTLEKFYALLEQQPIFIDLRIAVALLKHHTLRPERFTAQVSEQR